MSSRFALRQGETAAARSRRCGMHSLEDAKRNDSRAMRLRDRRRGSAGCVLADRLSADGRHRVVLLEAGGKDRNPWIHIPLGYGRTMFDKRVNWMFETEPEPGLDNRRIKQPRGKVLGGSSSINGLLYVRGQAEDYDHWRELGN